MRHPLILAALILTALILTSITGFSQLQEIGKNHKLTWTDNALPGTVDYFEIGSDVIGDASDPDIPVIATTIQSVTEYSLSNYLTGFEETPSVWFYVRAVNVAGSTAWGATLNVKLDAQPSPPSGVSINNQDIVWAYSGLDVNGQNEDAIGYRVEIAASSDLSNVTIAATTLTSTVPLINVFTGLSGEYHVFIKAIGGSSTRSDPSMPLITTVNYVLANPPTNLIPVLE